MGCRFKIYHRTSSFIELSITIKKVSLLGSIRGLEKKNLYITRRTSFVNSMSIVKKMNPVGFLDSTCITAIGLNHLINYLLN